MGQSKLVGREPDEHCPFPCEGRGEGVASGSGLVLLFWRGWGGRCPMPALQLLWPTVGVGSPREPPTGLPSLCVGERSDRRPLGCSVSRLHFLPNGSGAGGRTEASSFESAVSLWRGAACKLRASRVQGASVASASSPSGEPESDFAL